MLALGHLGCQQDVGRTFGLFCSFSGRLRYRLCHPSTFLQVEVDRSLLPSLQQTIGFVCVNFSYASLAIQLLLHLVQLFELELDLLLLHSRALHLERHLLLGDLRLHCHSLDVHCPGSLFLSHFYGIGFEGDRLDFSFHVLLLVLVVVLLDDLKLVEDG